MGRDDFLRIAIGRRLSARDREMMIGAIQPVACQRDDVAIGRTNVGRTLDLHHRADGIVGQFVAGVENDIMGPCRSHRREITSIMQLVGQPFGGDAPDNRPVLLSRFEYGQFARLASHRALHRADKMSPRSPSARSVFSASACSVQSPGPRSSARPALQMFKPSNQQQALALQACFVESCDRHASILVGHPLQRAIQTRPAFLLDLASQGLLDLQFRARPQPFASSAARCRKPSAMSLEMMRSLRIVAPSHDDVSMGIVPVIDRHPFQPCSQIGFHARHEVTGV